jgi:hypothetical protein
MEFSKPGPMTEIAALDWAPSFGRVRHAFLSSAPCDQGFGYRGLECKKV